MKQRNGLAIEYERLYQRNEFESLQNTVINHVRYNIKSMYPEELIQFFLEEHVRKFVPYTGETQYDLEYNCKDKSVGTTTIFLDPLVKNHKKN